MTYIVITSSAKMPTSCWGTYRHVAVVEVDDPTIYPKMISTRAKNVRRIVRSWNKLNVGKTERSAHYVALAEAEALAAQLNGAAL